MKYYMITFDRDPDLSYNRFHEDFVNHPLIVGWCHYIKSSYILATNLSAKEIAEHFDVTAKKYAISNIHIVMSVNIEDHWGWQPKEAWDWIIAQR